MQRGNTLCVLDEPTTGLHPCPGGYTPAAELHGEAFSTNSPEGACPECHGAGRLYDVTERSTVPDDSLTIRQRAIAAWPTAWGGQNQRDILVTLGFDVDRRWRDLPKKDRDWILFTDEQPTVRCHGFNGFPGPQTAAQMPQRCP